MAKNKYKNKGSKSKPASKPEASIEMVEVPVLGPDDINRVELGLDPHPNAGPSGSEEAAEQLKEEVDPDPGTQTEEAFTLAEDAKQTAPEVTGERSAELIQPGATPKEKNAKEDAKEVKATNCAGVKRVAVKTRAVASDPPEEKKFSDQKSLEEIEAPEVAKSDHDAEVEKPPEKRLHVAEGGTTPEKKQRTSSDVRKDDASRWAREQLERMQHAQHTSPPSHAPHPEQMATKSLVQPQSSPASQKSTPQKGYGGSMLQYSRVSGIDTLRHLRREAEIMEEGELSEDENSVRGRRAESAFKWAESTDNEAESADKRAESADKRAESADTPGKSPGKWAVNLKKVPAPNSKPAEVCTEGLAFMERRRLQIERSEAEAKEEEMKQQRVAMRNPVGVKEAEKKGTVASWVRPEPKEEENQEKQKLVAPWVEEARRAHLSSTSQQSTSQRVNSQRVNSASEVKEEEKQETVAPWVGATGLYGSPTPQMGLSPVPEWLPRTKTKVIEDDIPENGDGMGEHSARGLSWGNVQRSAHSMCELGTALSRLSFIDRLSHLSEDSHLSDTSSQCEMTEMLTPGSNTPESRTPNGMAPESHGLVWNAAESLTTSMFDPKVFQAMNPARIEIPSASMRLPEAGNVQPASENTSVPSKLSRVLSRTETSQPDLLLPAHVLQPTVSAELSNFQAALAVTSEQASHTQPFPSVASETSKWQPVSAMTSEPSSMQPASVETVSRSGYLLKKGGSKKERSSLFGRKNWKRRFFFLDGATSQLAYYKERGDQTPQGVIQLSAQCSVSKYTHHSQKYVLALKCPDRENFLVAAESSVELEEWVAVLASFVQ